MALRLLEKYIENDPTKAAAFLEALSEEEAVEVLKSLEPSLAVQVVQHTNDAVIARLLQPLPFPLFKQIIESIDSEQAAAVFFHFPSHLKELLLLQLEEKKKREIQEILTYPEGSAGRLMSKDFLAFHSDLKVKDVIQKIRETVQQGKKASYTYVIDKEKRLVGVLNMWDTIMASPDASLESIMRRNVFSVNCFDDGENVANELSHRRYMAAPVINSDKRLLGIVKAEQLIDSAQEEATEDLQKMFGAGGDERVTSSIGYSLKKRLPWLHVNLITAFLAASVVAFFEDIISQITVLAVYLPVVAGQGGNAGAQSLAVVMRGLVMREVHPKTVKKLLFKETMIGAFNGLIIGLVVALVAWVWQGNPYLGIVIGLGMLVNLTVAGLSGAAIPLVMKAMRLDPAQCSNIILTTITDVVGFLAFLGFAVLFSNYLI